MTYYFTCIVTYANRLDYSYIFCECIPMCSSKEPCKLKNRLQWICRWSLNLTQYLMVKSPSRRGAGTLVWWHLQTVRKAEISWLTAVCLSWENLFLLSWFWGFMSSRDNVRNLSYVGQRNQQPSWAWFWSVFIFSHRKSHPTQLCCTYGADIFSFFVLIQDWPGGPERDGGKAGCEPRAIKYLHLDEMILFEFIFHLYSSHIVYKHCD